MTPFRDELRSRLKRRAHEVFGYMLNLAWIMLFRDLFVLLTGPDPPLYARFLTALLFTTIAVLATLRTAVSTDAVLENELADEDT